jgi:UDP-N-acetylglucosamine 4,6-dehydratase
MFKNKIITVFGGTGTVGSLIVEYLRTQSPKSIRVFSNDENSLWEKQQEWKHDGLRYLLGDIRDFERVKRALKGVDYVFNCAAVKHVPFAEYNPMEAVNVNIHGLSNIIEACIIQKVKKLLHISTDKACEPSTCMGATKMIGERLIQMRWAQNPEMDMVCVRSGNIWNSRGSIIPLIKEYKKQQLPFPLTDLDMKRYFIEPDKLLKFIMLVFENGKKGEIWIPKLKEVKITDLIKGMYEKEGSFKIVGRRKGEKLREKLFSETEINIKEYETYWIIESGFDKL